MPPSRLADRVARRIGKIRPGAEILALGGEKDASDLRIAIERLESIREFPDQSHIEIIMRRPANLSYTHIPFPAYPNVAHLRPSPLAIMPRRISRVPPRKEKDGADRISCASTATKGCSAP